jgi:hypothetical protein
MSRKLFSLNEDLQRLRSDGYFVRVIDEKFLTVQVPYVNARCEVARRASGRLGCELQQCA